MVSRSQKIRLGIFLIVSIFILLSGIAIITGSKLLKKSVTYYIRYQELSLTGLEIGSAVRYRGIRIGRIEDIYIDPDDITSIIVEITADPKTPIKEDTEAIVTYISFATGLKMIELQGGTNESNRLSPNSFIKAGQSMVDALTGQAEVITEKLELILNNLAKFTEAGRREQFFQLIETTNKTLASLQQILELNQASLNHTIQNIESITTNLDTFMVNASLVAGDIQEITRSQNLKTTVENVKKITSELEQANLSELIAKLTAAVEQTNRTFTHLDLTLLKSRHDILSSTEILRESLEYFNEFTRLISENPSLLLRSSPQQEIEER